MLQVVTPYAGLELLSTAVLMLDEGLLVTYANPAAETLLAHGRKHVIGVALDKALPGNPEFVERLHQSLASDAGFNEHDVELVIAGEGVHVVLLAQDRAWAFLDDVREGTALAVAPSMVKPAEP